MKHPSILFLPSFLVALSCGMPEVVLPTPITRPAVTPGGCISPEPTQKDIDRVLSFASGVIDPAEWERSYTVGEYRVAVTWQNTPLSAVIYLEALIFPCGYDEADLDDYFSGENWEIIFYDYENHELTSQCKTPQGLRLYEFDAGNQGLDYKIRYWARKDTDTRAIVLMIVFPPGSKSTMDDYSSRLFPQLTSCP